VLMDIKKKSQLTIPKEILEELNLRIGDTVDVFTKDGKIVIQPVKVIAVPKDEEYIWDEETKLQIKEGLSEYKAGKLKGYDSVDKMFEEIDS